MPKAPLPTNRLNVYCSSTVKLMSLAVKVALRWRMGSDDGAGLEPLGGKLDGKAGSGLSAIITALDH